MRNALNDCVLPLKYAPSGPLEISAHRIGNELELSVADRGPGLPPEVRARAFERFVRGASAGAGGVGLGLAICRGVAEVHGGSILAEARDGGGTTFRVRLPLAEPPPNLAENAAEESA